MPTISTQLQDQDIMKELGIMNLPAEMRDQILVKFTENLLMQVGLKVFGALSEDDQEEFEKLKDLNNPGVLNDFFQAKIPNYEELVQRQVKKSLTDFKKLVKDLS
ncbi:hypothetical protein HY061_02285 [Candidatus Azambacteria bacterium]|nr:hypothetical protein [Candidatus Azambacteria bacterium]